MPEFGTRFVRQMLEETKPIYILRTHPDFRTSPMGRMYGLAMLKSSYRIKYVNCPMLSDAVMILWST